MPQKRKSALSEVSGITQPDNVNLDAAAKIASMRSAVPSTESLVSGIFSGDISALSRAITFIESTSPAHQAIASDIIAACLPKSGKSVRIGITGVPGVGKSTFIEAFGKHLTSVGKKVAVLAVDPSSTISHGSILGDKTRMEELVKDPNAYIRPSASGETLGGVAAKTRESVTVCEAFGFDVIIIETVGVGQSETAVHGMVDFFLLLKIAGAGDELQGIKRGIMEMADAVVINKADGDNIKKAKAAKAEFQRALHLFPAKQSGWLPKVTMCSSLTKEGIEQVWDMISEYVSQTTENGYFHAHRSEQNIFWLMQTIDEAIRHKFYSDAAFSTDLEKLKSLVIQNKISAISAAKQLIDKIRT